MLGGCSVGSSIALLLALDHPELFDAVFLVGGNSASSSRYQSRIDGYRKDLGDYHIRHLRELVAPAFADSHLGKHLLEHVGRARAAAARARRSRRSSWPATTPRPPTASAP